MTSRIVFILGLVLSVTFMSCTQSPLAGGSEVGNPTSIAGRAQYADGRPVVQALVRIRPSLFLRDTSLLFSDSTDIHYTNDSGMFSIDSLDTGSYWVEINDNSGFASVIKCKMEPAERLVLESPTILRRTTIIKGTVKAANGAATKSYIRTLGLSRVAATDGSGNYTIEVPADTFSLHITAASDQFPTIDLPNIATVTDSVKVIPDLFHFTTCSGPQCDSLVVAAIIDSLDLSGVTVDSVATRGSGNRIVGLRFDGIALNEMPQSISQLSELQHISLSGCSLDDLPLALCRVLKLRSLRIRDNAITVIPDEIAWLPLLDTLNVGNNGIQKIPDEIAYLRDLDVFRCDSNPLITVANEIGYLSTTTSLSLAKTGIDSLPSSIIGMRSLRELDISQNSFTTIQPSVRVLPLLQTVRVDSNKICLPSDTVA